MTLLASGFFALRTPLLPFATLDGLTRERLRELVERPDVREALFVASPSLEGSIATWLKEPASEYGHKIERSLVRYLARMAGRPTPFGLFAGCSTGVVGDATALAFDDLVRHTRLDNDYLDKIADVIVRDPELRRAVVFRPSSSLYRAAGRVRYVAARTTDKGRLYELMAVDPTDYFDATLARAEAGATFDALVAALVSDEITHEDAEAFVVELVESQILVSELQPQITGPEPVHALIAKLEGGAATAPLARQLAHARDSLAALDREPIGVSPARYRAIAEALPPPVELARLFQVDLVKRAPIATLGRDVIEQLARAIELLHRLAKPPAETALSRFGEAFTRRYETREVPLVEALDDEAGIGFAAPSDTDEPWTPLTTVLVRHLDRALRDRVLRVELSEVELAGASKHEPPPLPGALAVLATLGSNGDILVANVSGPSGANWLGRFCHGDAQLAAAVESHLRAEEAQRSDAIFAELVHLPEGRIGNVLLRPVLRGHEIPYLGHSGAPADRQIPVTDLVVSVVRGRIVIRLRRLDREVIPRLTTAHATSGGHNLPVYRFLSALQHQDQATLSWTWGPLTHAPFLPRVCVGSLVLSLARWRLDAADLRLRVGELRERLGLPRWIAITDGDNVLPIDLDSSLGVETFEQLAAKQESLVVTEVFDPTPTHARGPEGAYAHELIVPFVVDQTPQPTLHRPVPANVTRRFAPGSEWIYAKLYGGAASADRILTEAIAPIVSAERSWFFVRYGDPDPHLRVRIHGTDMLPALHAAAQQCLDAGLAWRYQLDTYEREVERYGGATGIELAERLFWADSDACIALLSECEPDARWRLVVRGMDLLLDDLGFALAERRAIVRGARQVFARELTIDERELADRYRAERATLDASLGPGLAPLDARSLRIRPLADALRAVAVPIEELAAAFLHMHANRQLRLAQTRREEHLVYYMLDRVYEGRLARRG